MPAAKYSDEFKTQVVREVIEKDRTISSVAASYDLVAQTVGNWVARYKKEHATDQDRKKASESAGIAKLRAENRELRQENEFLKKQPPGLPRNDRDRALRADQPRRRPLSHLLNVPVVGRVKIRVLLLARPTPVTDSYQERRAGDYDQGRF